MDSALKNLIRVGIVSSTNPAACSARVAFEDKAAMVSFDLPILVRGSLQTKDYWMPGPGEQVVCLFLPSGSAQGFIIGSLYSKKDQPPVTDASKRHISFPDGTTIEYDQDTHTMIINAVGPVNITAPKGITLSATDPAGTGVQITGKNASESW
ncbi:MAG TPA: phage baseplate assembly protein V [Bacillota bacterium]|nr:phage baseplate assembly protein V [Bacillota bacterium]